MLNNGLIAAMDDVGEKFSIGDLFVPKRLRAARVMKEAMELLRLYLGTLK